MINNELPIYEELLVNERWLIYNSPSAVLKELHLGDSEENNKSVNLIEHFLKVTDRLRNMLKNPADWNIPVEKKEASLQLDPRVTHEDEVLRESSLD